MKNFKVILKTSLIIGVVLATASCQQVGTRYEIDMLAAGKQPSYIEFGNYVNAMTRASRHKGNGNFSVGDTMAVWGDQAIDGVQDVIFNNQDVRYTEDTTWTYDNKKLWYIGATYAFYGFFPYSKTLYEMSDDGNRFITVPEYTTPDDPDKQIDLMISERRKVSPLTTVDMFFHHILSGVNVSIKVSDDLDTVGVDSIVLKSLKLNNIHSTGTYQQTGWSQERAVGSWTGQKDYMQIPAITDLTITKATQHLYTDYLMIPQKLFTTDAHPKDVTIDAIFRIAYNDGTTLTFKKEGVRLSGVTGRSGNTTKVITSWDPNYQYNYTLVFNPKKASRIWDADGDAGLQIDPATGDTLKKDDDTPTPGIMRYDPDQPNVIYIFEDTDGDQKPDKWVPCPIVWEDVDGDKFLEAGLDRDGDGHIDDIDGDAETQQEPEGDPINGPSDGNPNNPKGKDVILVHIDSDGDGDIDDDDEWFQIQKDSITGVIIPARDEESAVIELTATVHEWDQRYTTYYSTDY